MHDGPIAAALRRVLRRARPWDGAPRGVADLTRQAFSDPLTGLPNRLLFDDRLALALARARRQQTLVSVLFCDLDGFKQVNDTLGHRAGDALLVQVAERMSGVLRPMDTVARFGGDEFTVLLDHLEEPGDALKLAGRISRCVEHPIELDGRVVRVSASIGVAFGGDADDDPAELLAQADQAMYRAKRRGPSQIAVFDPALQARRERRSLIGTALRQALERSELTLVYEPVVELASGRVAAVEARHGWQQPARRTTSRAELYAAADELGLAAVLGRQALTAAAEQARRWAAGEDEPLAVAVDVAAGVFRDPDLPERVAALIAGLAPGLVQLEVTESLVLRDPSAALGILERLARAGAWITLDEVGADPGGGPGGSAFNLLPRLPLSGIKVWAGVERARLSAMGAYAAERGLSLSLCGVADSAALENARTTGVSQAQGSALSTGLRAEEVLERHRRRRTSASALTSDATAFWGRDRRAVRERPGWLAG